MVPYARYAIQVIVMLCCLAEASRASDDPNLGASDRAAFEAKYAAWKQHLRTPQTTQEMIASTFPVDAVFNNTYFRDLVAMGPTALPHMFARLDDDRILLGVIRQITKFQFRIVRTGDSPRRYVFTIREFPQISSEGGPPGPPSPARVYKYWWREGRHMTPKLFGVLYGEWRAMKDSGDTAGAKDRYQRMVDLGIVALPCMVAKVQAGDRDLIPAIAELSDNAVAKDATPEAVQAWWARKKPELRVLLEADPTSQPAR
jgi:hypothetical protein